MEIIFAIITLVLGFVLLSKGADFFVDGASKIAIKLHIPEIVVGLTIVAMGTSLPEAAVSIASALQNSAGIAIGNVLGSNVMNVALILGLSSVIATLPIKKNTQRFEIPFVIVITGVLLALGFFSGEVNRLGALILVVLFIAFLGYLWWLTKNGEEAEEIEPLKESDTYLKLILITIGGAIAIVFGSEITVRSAKTIAEFIGLSERVIGLTVIAFGTSLPELMTSTAAAKKGKTDIAIGNIVGSNIFNILFVLGISGLVSPSPIPFASEFFLDGVIAIIVALMLFIFTLKDRKLKRWHGMTYLAFYAAYLTYLIMM